MIRDAIREAARELWVWTAAGALLLVLFVPAVAGLGIAVQSRGTLDGVLAGTWVLAMLAALRLGGRLAGDGLRAYVVPGVGETRWLACRGFGFGVVLAATACLASGGLTSMATAAEVMLSLVYTAAQVGGVAGDGPWCRVQGAWSLAPAHRSCE